PEGWVATLALSVSLILGYGTTAEILRRKFTVDAIFGNRRELSYWFVVVACGTLATALLYISLLCVLDFIPDTEWFEGVRRYWIGDLVGVMISMPIIWLLASSTGRVRLRKTTVQWEALAYCILMTALIWFTFMLYHKTRF